MATKKKSAKKRATKTAEPHCPQCDALYNTLAHVLHASGSATTAPCDTLAALLLAARGIELALESQPGADGESYRAIGMAHALARQVPDENLLNATNMIIANWAYAQTEPDAKKARK